MSKTVYVVGTPIGNLGDITHRALSILGTVDIVAAEDTRVTKKLLSHYGISTRCTSLNEHTTDAEFEKLYSTIASGGSLAIVTDAGTPGVSDPGGRFVAFVRQKDDNVSIVAVPGPSSLTAFLSIAGVYTPRGVLFLGFPPHKKGRQTFLRELAEIPRGRIAVLFESNHRILKLLTELQELDARFHVIIGRELTKTFEEVIQGSPSEVYDMVSSDPKKQKGEFVVGIMRD